MLNYKGFITAVLLAFASASVHAAPEFSNAPDKYEFRQKPHPYYLFLSIIWAFPTRLAASRILKDIFTFDDNHPEASEVDVTLKPDSVDTSVPALDKVLVGKDFFNTAQFPTIHFKSG